MAEHCPTPDDLQGLVDGHAGGAEAERLRQHVDRCHECQAGLAVLLVTQDATRGPKKAMPPAQPEIGTTVADRYRIDARIGEGGMATVYAAWDRRLDRTVALKLVRSTVGEDPGARTQRLVVESKAMARLRHPNVVTVYDAGQWNDEAFVAMELVEGETLREWSKQKHSWRERVLVLRAAGEGLAAAHDECLIHRDFKPDNVFVDRRGGVFVGDFGLVQLASAAPLDGATPETLDELPLQERSHLTATGAFVGTPAYMAPEQMRGGAVGPAADVFGFCVTAYEVLYGERPFGGASLSQLHADITAQRVRPPGGGQVPSPIRRVLLKGLSAVPERRPQSMRMLLTELDGVAQGRGRRRSVIGAGVALSVALAGWLVWPAPSVSTCDSEGDLRWTDQDGALLRQALEQRLSPARAARVSDRLELYATAWRAGWTTACGLELDVQHVIRVCLGGGRRSFEALTALGSEHAEAVELGVGRLPSIDACLTEGRVLEQPLPSEPVLRAQVAEQWTEFDRLRTLQDAGQWKAVHPEVEAFVDASRALGYLPLTAAALWARGVAETRLGRDSAQQTLQETARTAVAAGHDVIAARAWIELSSHAQRELVDYGRAHEYAGHAEAALARIEGRYDTRLLESSLLKEHALVYQVEGRLQRARELLETALALVEDLPGHDVDDIREALAVVAAAEGRFDDSIALHRDTLRHRERNLAHDHPGLGLAHLNLGAALFEAGNMEDSLHESRLAEGLFEGAFGADHPDVHRAGFNQAQALVESNRHEEAEAIFIRLEPALDGGGDEELLLAMVYESHGYVALQLGRVEEGLALNAKAGPVYERVGVRTLYNLSYRVGRAELLLEADRPAAGLVAAQQAVAAVQRNPELAPAMGPQAGYILGRALVETDNPDEAIDVLRAALAGLDAQGQGQGRGLKTIARGYLARALWGVGRKEEATTMAREAYATMRTTFTSTGEWEDLARWADAAGLSLDGDP